MALETQKQQPTVEEPMQLDEGFANKLENMLAGLVPNEQSKPSVKQVEEGLEIEAIMAQANDGIALAQTIESCILDCSQILLQMYNHIQIGLEQGSLEQAVFSNQLLYLKEQLQQRVDLTSFNGVQVFTRMLPMQISTSIHAEEQIVLHIPNINTHAIGELSWQTKAGVHTPHRTESSVEYRFNQTLVTETDRIRLLIDGKDLVQEYLHDVATTLQVVSSLINNAQLSSISLAEAGDNNLTMHLPSMESVYTGQLFIEQVQVSSEDSVAAISAENDTKAEHALHVISSAMNMYADYRDQVNLVAEQIYRAVEQLMQTSAQVHQLEDMTMPLAQAVAKDVSKMMEQNCVQSMLTQAQDTES